MQKKNKLKNRKTCIICDFDSLSGFGHYYRSLVLYKELRIQKFNPFFLLSKKNKKFVYPYIKDIKTEFFDFNFNKDPEKLIKFLEEKNINFIIIDSYKINNRFEKKIRNKFFLISIDDKLKTHSSNIVFNSRLDHDLIYDNVLTRWYFGKDFVLFNKASKKKFRNDKLKKILIHAGGADAYYKNIKFYEEIFSYLDKNKFKVDVLCSNRKTKKKLQYQNKIFDNKKNQNKVKFIKFDFNLRNSLKNYDLVIGPAGNITYESINAGTIPLSFPLVNDKRDSIISWNLFGNFLHLTHNESKNKIIIKKILSFICCEFKTLNNEFYNLTKNFSSGEKNILGKIKKVFYSKKDEFNSYSINKFQIKKAKYSEARLFLIGRNQKKVRTVSSNPNHKITWPEHLNWWKNQKIKKFVLFKNNIPKGFHWVKKFYSKEINTNIIISGWFPFNDKDEENLKYSKLILDHQVKYVKNNYKNSLWIININKNNAISLRMNLLKGFLKADNDIQKIGKKIFRVNLLKFNIYQMKT